MAEDSENENQRDITQVDFSFCGSMIMSVSNEVHLWHVSSGKKIGTLPEISELPNSKYKCRTVRFVNLNAQSKRAFFIAAHNCRIRNSKQDCKLSLWAFDQETKAFSILEIKEVAKDVSFLLELS